jgi:hypothetical protein
MIGPKKEVRDLLNSMLAWAGPLHNMELDARSSLAKCRAQVLF